MVRLKVLSPACSRPSPLFQFHYGTIKRFSFGYNKMLDALFQFHYGTIKRLEANVPTTITIAFQFHYGTIKSLFVLYPGKFY